MRRILYVILILLAAACRDRAPTPKPEAEPDGVGTVPAFVNVGGEVRFEGDASCITCHETEYAGYQTHGMANSMYRLTPENAVADFPGEVIYHAPTDLRYRAFQEDGKFFQEEFRLDENGERTHELGYEIEWVIGSGTAARTYLTVVNDHYIELPLTWYTGDGGRWDFSPGYREKNSRFDREIPDRCMACHNSYPESVPFVNGRYTTVPEGIGCERCHGPGSVHVEARLENPEPAAEVDLTIVNPAHLPLDLRLDVCQQCHLNGTVSILRRDRGPFEFRPSDALSAHISLFSQEDTQTDRIEVISHAERMKLSDCFLQTQSASTGMDCTTCHNPHEGFRDAGPGYFNDTCLTCHPANSLPAKVSAGEADNHTATSDCNACHMPKVEAIDAPHSSFTDHWIRVVGDTEEREHSGAASSDDLVAYYDGDKGSVYEGMAFVILGTQKSDTTALRRGARMLKASIEHAPGFGEAQYQLGYALFALGELQSARGPLEEAVRLDPDVPERLNTLAQLYERIQLPSSKVERLYRRAVEIQPLHADIRVNLGRFLETQGKTSAAIEQYRRAVDLMPGLEEAHYNLGTALIGVGDFEAGAEHLSEAIRLDPDYTRAYGNLAVLLATQGQTREARVYFERAVEANPDDPVALNNLASFYLNEGLDAEAEPLLRKAVKASPDYTDALSNLALALLRLGDDESAGNYAKRALVLDPENKLAREIVRALN